MRCSQSLGWRSLLESLPVCGLPVQLGGSHRFRETSNGLGAINPYLPWYFLCALRKIHVPSVVERR